MKGFGMSVYNDGRMDERIDNIKAMLENGISMEQIAQILQISVEQIEKYLKGDY